jgi:hypothetical protein
METYFGEEPPGRGFRDLKLGGSALGTWMGKRVLPTPQSFNVISTRHLPLTSCRIPLSICNFEGSDEFDLIRRTFQPPMTNDSVRLASAIS